MLRVFFIIFILFLLTNCQTTRSSYLSKKNPYKVDLENCLDKFYGPKVPLGKFDNYIKWSMEKRDSLESWKTCETEIYAFLSNAKDVDMKTIQPENWAMAMVIYKNTFKPNQIKGLKKTFNTTPDAIGNWWAIPVGVIKYKK